MTFSTKEFGYIVGLIVLALHHCICHFVLFSFVKENLMKLFANLVDPEAQMKLINCSVSFSFVQKQINFLRINSQIISELVFATMSFPGFDEANNKKKIFFQSCKKLKKKVFLRSCKETGCPFYKKTFVCHSCCDKIS